jgi:hypothetical protein
LNELGRNGVIYDAQEQTDYRPNENATDRARLDTVHTSVANDANDRKGNDDAETEAATNKDGSSPRRESANNAAELVTETAGSPEARFR